MYKPPFHVFAELDGPGSYSVIDADAKDVCLCSSGECADLVAAALNGECEDCRRLDQTLQDALSALTIVVRELISQRDEARRERDIRSPPARLLSLGGSYIPGRE